MIKVEIQRNLIGLEDLLVGVGVVQQTRGPTGSAPVNVTRINAQNLPYDGDTSLAEKLIEIESLAQSLSVVDEQGNFLTGYINTSENQLNLAGRLWNHEIDANQAEIYYGSIRILKYNPTTGDFILPEDTDYIAADAALSDTLTMYIDTGDSALNDAITALENSLGTAALLDVGTGNNNIVQLDGTAKLPAIDGSQLTNLPDSVKIGVICYTAASTPDSGYLECNGQEISRSTYSVLFARIGTTYGAGNGSTTFNIPNIQGEFIRGWDNGRGVDPGRVFGSLQMDELKAHTHDMRGKTTGAAGSPVAPLLNAVGGSQSTLATGGAETRPRNIALLAQIKAL